MRKPLLFTFVCFVFLNLAKVSGQQLPLFTQYRDYYGYINPASVSIDFFVSDRTAFNAFGISHRRQWINSTFPTVVTTVGRGEFFFRSNNGPSFSVGGYFMSDKAGATSLNALYGRGAL